jgi:hypothetical protein
MSNDNTLPKLKQDEYDARIAVERLRRQVFSQPDPSAADALTAQLRDAEETLRKIEQAITAATDPLKAGAIISRRRAPGLLGPETTGLDARVQLRMAQVPTATCHLFDPEQTPLLTCTVSNVSANTTKRLRVSAFVDGYSATSIATVELKPAKEFSFNLFPTFFPERIRTLNELTRATLNVMLEDMDTGKPELHATYPIWLLARTTAPLAVKDPMTGGWQDMTRYLGAFVTPNAPAIMTFLRKAADRHPSHALAGYQGDKPNVVAQVKAIYEALQADASISYVNSVVDFSPDLGSSNQRVRLPSESLADREANCIDGTVLFASLLEAVSLSPALVIVPGHAFVGWEPWSNKGGDWQFLETTMIHDFPYDDAFASAQKTAANYKSLGETLKDPTMFRLLPLRDLRSQYNITPMG